MMNAINMLTLILLEEFFMKISIQQHSSLVPGERSPN